MTKIFLVNLFLWSTISGAYQLVPPKLKKCSSENSCVIVNDRSCKMPFSTNKTKIDDWKKIDDANYLEVKKQFPHGAECKPVPPKVEAVCIDDQCGWKDSESR